MDSLTTRFAREVFSPYLDLLKAEYRFHPAFAHARQMWEEKLTMAELVNGPFLEKSQMYASGAGLDELPLHEKTKATIRRRLGNHNLYQHQTEAVNLILKGQNAVIATGTSSGKTLCYQIPILDDLLRDSSPGLRAIIIYPLNALVNDQLEEWETMLRGYPQITFARFTGQTPNTQIDYENRLKDIIRAELEDQPLREQERERKVQEELRCRKAADPPHRLNHREAIRNRPPHVLVTNFSMLEYLLERPVDASVFEGARLKFLVLDEVHAYRGVQATEIAFLARRLKDRLGVASLVSIATSATLGDPNKPDSRAKVRRFVSDLFDGDFAEPNPVHGTPAQPELPQPAFRPAPAQYVAALTALRRNENPARALVQTDAPLGNLLLRDENLYALRKEILTRPIKLEDAAQQLWPEAANNVESLSALLELVAAAPNAADLLPTRLHYFVRAQDGLHVCLHRQCPARRDGNAAFFVSRRHEDTEEGHCPTCWAANQISLLVEVVTCRKCGYLFGALQDLGPRRAQTPDPHETAPKPAFDSFSTELGWAADSFWSYFSVGNDLSYPLQPGIDEDEDEPDGLSLISWCVQCGKKSEKSTGGDNCRCDNPHLRELRVFHRQCLHKGRYSDLYEQKKKPLTVCHNCGARNASGLEPVRRFQESDDETGLAMALPLAHFAITPKPGVKPPRKLLCFTDHRQRAAAFPALLEEETFTRDLGRKIVKVLEEAGQPLDFIDLGESLAGLANPHSDTHDPEFFLPTSRLPDEPIGLKEKANLWLAEVFSYFGVPDSARESAEDLGLVVVEYKLKEREIRAFHELLPPGRLSLMEAAAALQVLLGFVRQRKAFRLPKGRVAPDDVAFGRITPDIGFALESDKKKNLEGWMPRRKQHNRISDYLSRICATPFAETRTLGESIWNLLDREGVLLEKSGKWQLDYERLFALCATQRYVCGRCGMVTAYSARGVCPRKGCAGTLEAQPFDAAQANIIERWVADIGEPRFASLKSEEHTAQINKDVAKRIEDDFRNQGRKNETAQETEARAAGVNLLSSTTTFEMGINIGDLQKVLLRNAPPNSASYVQRVGRAGRGQDKNAVCVTLCKRTKYDADAWHEPTQRLMSGAIRPPTVFTANRIIAQRHFNAVVFARFLRQKIRDERALRDVDQKTLVAPFIAPEARNNIPPDWLKLPTPGVYLDFPQWLAAQTEAQVFHTAAKADLLKAIDEFPGGLAQAGESYGKVMASIVGEMSALLEERKKLFRLGGATGSIDQAIKNLLGSDVIAVLAKRGFLPRYAFPLDVVPLETGWSRWSSDSDVTLSRDRAIAIAEFAPGTQVIARKRIFTSAGLYVASRADRPEREWYAKCRDCGHIRTARVQDELLVPCPICQQTTGLRDVQAFVQPQAFSIELEKKGVRGERHRRTSLVRQRQSATHFIDLVEDSDFAERGLFRVALKGDGQLFRYNLGPQQKGFMVCHVCGRSEPNTAKISRKHRRLRPLGQEAQCPNENLWKKPIAYGHQFTSSCLLVRPVFPATARAFVSLAYALQRGVCRVLDLDTSDIGVTGRGVTGHSTLDAAKREIVLFDKTPGGAGFVREAYNLWPQVVEQAATLCRECSCREACYNCLKDYYNQSAHEHLRRTQVKDFFEQLA